MTICASLPAAVITTDVINPLPTPKFQLGQMVCYTESRDFRHIIGLIYATEASVKAVDYHYVILFDPASPSTADGISSDWGFEEDLALLHGRQPCRNHSQL
jgi:hypothetical protein